MISKNSYHPSDSAGFCQSWGELDYLCRQFATGFTFVSSGPEPALRGSFAAYSERIARKMARPLSERKDSRFL